MEAISQTQWIGLVVFVLMSSISGSIYYSKKSWEKQFYAGLRNGPMYFLLFSSFVICFVLEISIPTDSSYSTIDLLTVLWSMFVFFLGVVFFLISFLIKRDYLRKKGLL